MYERYTNGARRSVFYARQHALHRALGHIGNADLLLGIRDAVMRSQSPFSPVSEHWSEIGEIFGYPVMDECLKDEQLLLAQEAKVALRFAAQEAGLDSQFAIDPGMLLRGVVRAGGPVADKMAAIGLSLAVVRKASRDNRVRATFWFQLRYLWVGRRRSVLAGLVVVLLCGAILYLRSQN